ncbi:MAG: DNA repair protein RecN [Prevotella sp.]|nr:DNA repair protein RecN [Prevotella sp.]
MLTRLYIKNFALIDELDITFGPGFSVITGETGAGKSIILGAMSLLLGARADTKTVKEGEGKCIVEAAFDNIGDGLRNLLEINEIDVPDEECIIRREVNAAGKSRAFINDTPTGLALLKDVGEQLIDIHSQHQNLLLKDNSFQLSVVDTIAGNRQLLLDYSADYKAFCTAREALDAARENAERSQRDADFIRFQYDELSALGLQDGEQERLEQQASAMQHAEDIKRALFDADAHLNDEQTGILTRLRRSQSAVAAITPVFAQAGDAAARLDTTLLELKDIAADIAAMLAAADYDPAESERVAARLDAIYTLEKKHRAGSVAALIEIQNKYKAALDAIDNSDTLLAGLEKSLAEAESRCRKLAEKLSSQRQKATTDIERDTCARLEMLGVPGVRFKVEIARKELGPDGQDRAEFLFSANPGMPLRAVSDVASGGEISRVMLALKAMLSGAVRLPTIIFDEIDAGVSGKVAEQMGIVMEQMGRADRQVVSITHLPQIAARGAAHYKVFKEIAGGKTATRMQRLSDSERIGEIAQMLSGSSISSAAVDNAKKLLQIT